MMRKPLNNMPFSHNTSETLPSWGTRSCCRCRVEVSGSGGTGLKVRLSAIFCRSTPAMWRISPLPPRRRRLILDEMKQRAPKTQDTKNSKGWGSHWKVILSSPLFPWVALGMLSLRLKPSARQLKGNSWPFGLCLCATGTSSSLGKTMESFAEWCFWIHKIRKIARKTNYIEIQFPKWTKLW